ncbi:MAG: TIM barrel protein [Candidatus Pacearchaeota archaeon]|jgi:hypothetical protein
MAEEKRGYTISDIYQGGYSTMVPPDNVYSRAGSLGMTTKPDTANILQSINTTISSGARNVDVTAVIPEVFDSMPQPHLREVNRMAKLTGVNVSMHGPVIDVAGIDPRSGFSESEREVAERKVAEALLRSHDLNPQGNIFVNFHTSEGIQGSELLPPAKRKENEEYQKLMAINRESGRITALEAEKEFHPGRSEIKEFTKTPEMRLDSANNTEWKNSLFQVEVNRENAERIMHDVHPMFIQQFTQLKAGAVNPNEFSKEERAEIGKIHSAFEFIDQARISADSLFSKAYELAKMDGDQKRMDELKKASEDYGKTVGIMEDGKINPNRYLNPKVYSEALRQMTEVLEEKSPKLWVPLEEFQIKKTAETFGNAAWQAYSKYKDTSPVLVIENPPATHALSKGEDVRAVVEKTRDVFIDNAKKSGMTEDEARKQANKLIGATWDVGHINILRRYGYTEEDIVKESQKVAPVLKQIHLSDNFGMEHTELPMGMGNVPFKQIMEKLGEKGYDARKIIEAGHWWKHFGTPPFQENLESLGSPIYSMKMAPYWSQASGLYQGYQGGLAGNWLPQINYETFGSGFSRLPSELGGQSPGAQGSRMSGRPME